MNSEKDWHVATLFYCTHPSSVRDISLLPISLSGPPLFTRCRRSVSATRRQVGKAGDRRAGLPGRTARPGCPGVTNDNRIARPGSTAGQPGRATRLVCRRLYQRSNYQQGRVDYCCSMLVGVSGHLLDRLQSALNAAARLDTVPPMYTDVPLSQRHSSVLPCWQ